MATRIVIMKEGVIQQVVTLKEVYDQPDNVFGAGVIGSPAMNFFNGHIEVNFLLWDRRNFLSLLLSCLKVWIIRK